MRLVLNGRLVDGWMDGWLGIIGVKEKKKEELEEKGRCIAGKGVECTVAQQTKKGSRGFHL